MRSALWTAFSLSSTLARGFVRPPPVTTSFPFGTTATSKSSGVLSSQHHRRIVSSVLAMGGGGQQGLPPAPVADREEDRVVLAGKLKDDDSGKKALVRQAEDSEEPLIDPPIAVKDPYGWMRDESRTVTRVLDHLNAENKYSEAVTSHLGDLREELYQEMLSSVQETDYTTPRPRDNCDYLYYTRSYKGKAYKVYCRAPKPTGDKDLSTLLSEWDGTAESLVLPGEEVYLDVNELAKDQKYCSPGAVKPSPSHKLLAYSVDFTGGETCKVKVENIETKEVILDDPDLEIYGSLIWGKDDSTLFYTKMDDAHRPYQFYRRILGGGKDGEDVEELLFEEKDELFWMGIDKSLDGKFLFVDVSSKETSEVYFLDLEDSESNLQSIAKRRKKVLYEVDHLHGQWWIVTNVDETPNMRLMVAPAIADSESKWEDVLDPTSGEKLFDGGYEKSLSYIAAFKNHVVCSGRQGGIPRIWVLPLDGTTVSGAMQMLEFPEPAHDVGISTNAEFDTDTIAIGYDSLITPASTIEVSLSHPNSEEHRKVLKEKAVPNYDRSLYGCDRVWVKSRGPDSVDIPVSIVYRKDVMEEHKKTGKPIPTHLYGYGSYGSSMEASFVASRLTLLNRGMVFVIAHIRGGAEMGRQWYEEPNGAKYLCKKNTFNDFVDVARWLVADEKLTDSENLSCEGRSAGGLLIGACINQAPELFRAAILGVPFVDVVCTMIDASIPLTVVEWEEWGNPNEKKYHDYMMEYSPINFVQPNAKYPSCLLTGGLHDPRVQFWEPAKFAAELRHTQGKESGPVCLKMDMSAGHFSASDRYKYYRELSFDYAFLLDQLGLLK